ncbi:Peroxisomal membrane protein PEX30 OS=Saccharomyces cerevisiae (strain ATCC 204508 / S288c) GN=PEX30 PE=1 SV=1 [Rhizoctonia solani AG-1 IB]|uniref:Peroxisomal membrane protein PEX30 n=1 Tax=Thanatephorus cucumeris (strain AG1-IB / isolate 7/3/14) TaxID=1108050 RepID=A0A0B7F711_THACB|nr:Peroxisomal membrane protein PEX30 OS=Saccharomyces cerevisiae (strain ATCC 204508 / S288c) GN=PEX30 PE=1 SV=1 [Rhizoctonia solani AG-1 IB]
MAGVSPPGRVQPIISSNNPPVLLDFVSHVPAPVTRLLVEQAGTIKVLRRAAEIASWRSPKPSESWLLLGVWWFLCGSVYFGVRYLVPVIVILPALWKHVKAQTWWPWRSPNQPPHEPAAASDVTVAATISDITILRLLLPAFLFQQPPVAPRSPIIEALQTFHNTLPLRSVLRATAILYVPYLALTYWISLPVIFGVLGTIILTARSPWISVLRTLVSGNGWARWAWRRIWAFLTGQPIVVPGSGFAIQQKPVALPPKLGKTIKITQSLQPSRLRFRFDILENQRWWVGIDWSSALLPNERTSWCSPPPHLAALSPPITFALPSRTSHVDKTLKIRRNAFWRWDDPEWTVVVKTSADSHASRVQLPLPDPSSDTEGRLAKGLKRVGENLPESVSGSSYSRRTIDSGDDDDEKPPLSPLTGAKDSLTDQDGWIYADNKWEMPSPKGGIGKYTRYRTIQNLPPRQIVPTNYQALPTYRRPQL